MDETQLRAWAHTTPLEARFWSKVDIIDDDISCWEWQRARHPEGYGQFQWTAPGEIRNRAHPAPRVALYLTTGVMPVLACHTCDNPPCCRPGHLYDGSHAANGADKAQRGRARGKSDQRGERNDFAVLTDAIVLEARRRARAGEGHDAIAASLGVQRPTLTLAIRGKTWSHLDVQVPPVTARRGGTRLTEDDVRRIRSDRADGASLVTLAERHGLTVSAISHIVRRKSWGHVTP